MILRKQGERFDDETLRQFGLIRGNVQSMGRLIDDLLDFSRLGKQEMSIANLDMEGLINDVWQNLLTVNPGRNMTLHLRERRPGMGDRHSSGKCSAICWETPS